MKYPLGLPGVPFLIALGLVMEAYGDLSATDPFHGGHPGLMLALGTAALFGIAVVLKRWLG